MQIFRKQSRGVAEGLELKFKEERDQKKVLQSKVCNASFMCCCQQDFKGASANLE